MVVQSKLPFPPAICKVAVSEHEASRSVHGVSSEIRTIAKKLEQEFKLEHGREMHATDVLPVAVRALMQWGSKLRKWRNFVDLMSGCDEYTTAMLNKGRHGAGFEITRDPDEDITKLAGLLWCGVMIFELVPGSTVTAAPTCSSWVVINRFTSGRDKNIFITGDIERKYVQKANVEVQHTAWLFFLATALGHFTMLEQPASTIMQFHPGMAAAMDVVGMDRQHVWMGAFGATTPKSTFLFDTFPKKLMTSLKRKKPASKKKHYEGNNGVYYVCEHGWFNGGKALKATSKWQRALPRLWQS